MSNITNFLRELETGSKKTRYDMAQTKPINQSSHHFAQHRGKLCWIAYDQHLRIGIRVEGAMIALLKGGWIFILPPGIIDDLVDTGYKLPDILY
jgi:hypothetical protein